MKKLQQSAGMLVRLKFSTIYFFNQSHNKIESQMVCYFVIGSNSIQYLVDGRKKILRIGFRQQTVVGKYDRAKARCFTYHSTISYTVKMEMVKCYNFWPKNDGEK